MKKILLLVGLIGSTLFADAQAIFNVEYPTSIGGRYPAEFADTAGVGGSTWGGFDIREAENSVVDTIVFVQGTNESGTIGGSPYTYTPELGCNTLINAAQLAGKIAVVYRGECQFGSKALFAQDAGAVGVIIVNNIPGPALGMLAGTDGANVTIPVVMISQADGVTLATAVAGGDVVVFLGNKQGHFANDVSFEKSEMNRFRYRAALDVLSVDASELDVRIGAWVRNPGVNDQYNVKLTNDVSFGGNSVYNNFTTVDTLLVGDSVFMTLPTFSRSSYPVGEYTMVYSLESDSTDGDIFDNTDTTRMTINNKYISRSKVDPATSLPLRGDNYYRFAKNCMAFSDSNASRIGVRGFTFSAVAASGQDLVEKYVEIKIYEWDGFDETDLNEIAIGDYSYPSNLEYDNVTANFPFGVALEDDVNYLFCVEFEQSTDDTVYFGSSQVDLGQTVFEYQENSALYEGIDGTRTKFRDIAPSLSVETISVAEVGIVEAKDDKILAYPNPAKNFISIPVGNVEVESVNVYDITGKIVSSQSMNIIDSVISLDVSTIANGTYIIALNYSDNTSSKINVVINK